MPHTNGITVLFLAAALPNLSQWRGFRWTVMACGRVWSLLRKLPMLKKSYFLRGESVSPTLVQLKM
jgi:hypothetical protein